MRGYSQRCAATLLGWEVQYPAKSRLCIQVGAALMFVAGCFRTRGLQRLLSRAVCRCE